MENQCIAGVQGQPYVKLSPRTDFLLLYFTQDYPVRHIKAAQSQTLFQESGGCVDDHLGNMIVPRRFQSILSAFQIKK